MKKDVIEFKQKNMLCHRCLLNVVKTLSQIQDLEELEVNLETKRIKIKYHDADISRGMIESIVNEAIIDGSVKFLK